jgi:Fic family protein
MGPVRRGKLLAGVRLKRFAGRLRDQQSWIGGSSYNPCAATFAPPPPELVADLMDDRCAFCRTDPLPAIAQAAIAHAQVERIHPFADGKCRTGRALIDLVLRSRGFAIRVLPRVSLVLATGIPWATVELELEQWSQESHAVRPASSEKFG